MYQSRPSTPFDDSDNAHLPLARLRLLGGIWGEATGRRAPVSLGEKPLAVLAYLLLAPPEGVKSRDEVATLFWPELNAARSRRGLRQAIHALRIAFGKDVVRSVGKHGAWIPAGRVESDATDLRRAKDAGRLEQAVELYQGEFLATARLLNTSEELQEWVVRERVELAESVVEASVELAGRASAAHDTASAAHWARRAMWASGRQESVLRRLLQGCCAAGLQGEAADLYGEHLEWLRRQGDLEPAPATRALVAQLLHPA